MDKQITCINFGCGLSVADNWLNYDASPTLLLQRIPVVRLFARRLVGPRFPEQVLYGDIVKGLPMMDGTADYVYCSHVLEHLALDDFRSALNEAFRVIKPGGIFRGVLPDFEVYVQSYLVNKSESACSEFMDSTSLGIQSRPRGLFALLRSIFGNSNHLWMWDFKGLQYELLRAGFVEPRRAVYGDSEYPVFNAVEDPRRWDNALGFECKRG